MASLVLITCTKQPFDVQKTAPVVGLGSVSAVYDLEVMTPYMFALERGRLLVLERDDPTHFRQVARLDIDPPRFRLARHGHRLFLTGFEPLAVIDITDPLQPRWLGHMDGFSSPWGDAFEVAGDLGFLVTRNDDSELSLSILDLSNRTSLPSEIGRVELGLEQPGWRGGLAVDGKRVWILAPGFPALAQGSLAVVDASDPAEPRVERTVLLPEGRHFTDVEVTGSLVSLLIDEEHDGLALFEDTGDD